MEIRARKKKVMKIVVGMHFAKRLRNLRVKRRKMRVMDLMLFQMKQLIKNPIIHLENQIKRM
jgi:hypothetical protein